MKEAVPDIEFYRIMPAGSNHVIFASDNREEFQKKLLAVSSSINTEVDGFGIYTKPKWGVCHYVKNSYRA